LFRLTNPIFPDGKYEIVRFHQFVVYIQYAPSSGFWMALSDFNGSIDAGLDQYLAMTQMNWTKEDGDWLMKILHDIVENPSSERPKWKLDQL
jgi:hypothetical protein